MTTLAIVVPTVGRPELGSCLHELSEQVTAGDRVLVVCDRPRRYDWCHAVVEGLRRRNAPGRWTVWNRDSLGYFGHAARNEALTHFQQLEDPPDWVWSIDDDDRPTPGALDAIREACGSGAAGWYAFRMRGGPDSHYDGVVLPNRGEYVLLGNVGTPMIVHPVGVDARWGTGSREEFGQVLEAGYLGDLDMAVSLRDELGDPEWVPTVVATVRPGVRVEASLPA